jgi:DNA polymerase-1
MGTEIVTTLWEWEMARIRMLARIKDNGIKVDKEFCKPRIIKGQEICADIKYKLGWNPGSTKQLGEFLLDEMKYPVLGKTEKGNPSFNKHAMEEYDLLLEHDGSSVAQDVFRYRGWQKTVSSNYIPYITLCDKRDIIHPSYMAHRARTGRDSCEDPNLQQIPKESEKEWNGDLKQAFVPRGYLDHLSYIGDTVLVEFDFAQLETRVTAAVAKVRELLEAFWDDVDVFQVMADTLGWTRDRVKLFFYMTIYGAGARKMSLVFKISFKEAHKMIDEFYERYPTIRTKAKLAAAFAKQDKFIEYWTGRRRHFPSGDYHKAFNAAIQGGAFEIVKRSGIRLESKIPWPLVLTVHDSYTVEMPIAQYNDDTCNMIKSILEDVPESKEMGVPFKVSYKKWGEKS